MLRGMAYAWDCGLLLITPVHQVHLSLHQVRLSGTQKGFVSRVAWIWLPLRASRHIELGTRLVPTTWDMACASLWRLLRESGTCSFAANLGLDVPELPAPLQFVWPGSSVQGEVCLGGGAGGETEVEGVSSTGRWAGLCGEDGECSADLEGSGQGGHVCSLRVAGDHGELGDRLAQLGASFLHR